MLSIPTIIDHLIGLGYNNPRDIFVNDTVNLGLELIVQDIPLSIEFSLNAIDNNVPFFAGRLAGTLVQGLGVGTLITRQLRREGVSNPRIATLLGITGTLNFTINQLGGAMQAVGNAYDVLVENGFDPNDITVDEVRRLVASGVTFGRSSFDPATGRITVQSCNMDAPVVIPTLP